MNGPSRKSRKNPGHKCIDNFVVHVWEGAAGYNNMANAFQHNMRASYLRISMINPLHELVPSAIAMMQVTRNRFSKDDVEDQWRRFRVLYNAHLRPVQAVMVTSGDSRSSERAWHLVAGTVIVLHHACSGWLA